MRIMYTSRLRKLKHAEEHTLARTRLVDEYGLGDNPDVLYSFADALYTNFRFADCFTVTSRYGLPLHLLRISLKSVSGYWASSLFMRPPCPCISLACTISPI